ncbi:MAG TPA: hypothetical protein V6D50_11810 [Chroococcales cyanobacterium]
MAGFTGRAFITIGNIRDRATPEIAIASGRVKQSIDNRAFSNKDSDSEQNVVVCHPSNWLNLPQMDGLGNRVHRLHFLAFGIRRLELWQLSLISSYWS